MGASMLFSKMAARVGAAMLFFKMAARVGATSGLQILSPGSSGVEVGSLVIRQR